MVEAESGWESGGPHGGSHRFHVDHHLGVDHHGVKSFASSGADEPSALEDEAPGWKLGDVWVSPDARKSHHGLLMLPFLAELRRAGVDKE